MKGRQIISRPTAVRTGFALIFALISGGQAIAQRACVEEVAGVCLRYGERKGSAPARPPASPEAAAEAALRMSADERKAVQRGLAARGYYSGGIDGAFGDGTRRAIARWQTDENRTASGFLSLEELRLLASAEAKPSQLEPVAAAAPEPDPEPVAKPEPVVVQPPPPPPKVDHPVAGRVYAHEYDMASIAKYTITVEREDAGSARVYLIADNGDSGFRKSCVVALSGPFECWLSANNWQPKRIYGALPEITLDLASGSPGGNVHRFWE